MSRMFVEIRGRTWSLLNGADGLGKSIEAFIITLIALNVVLVVAESEPSLVTAETEPWFRGFDTFSSLVFTFEYALRIWTAVDVPRFGHPIRGRLRYAMTPMALVDLAAILPFWLPMLITVDLRFVRALRLFRLFRLLKIGRYSIAIAALVKVFARKKEQLSMTFFTVSLMLVVFSSLVYFIEHPAQPEVFSSIPQTMWWAAATLTTVGYGDMYPVTSLGQLFGALISFTGVVIIAVPAGIVASGFTEEVAEQRAVEAEREAAERQRAEATHTPSALACPHCGKPLHLSAERAESGGDPGHA